MRQDAQRHDKGPRSLPHRRNHAETRGGAHAVIRWYAAVRRPLRTDGTRRESEKLHLPPEGPIRCSLVSCIERLKVLLGGHIFPVYVLARRHTLNDGIVRAVSVMIVAKSALVCGFGRD